MERFFLSRSFLLMTNFVVNFCWGQLPEDSTHDRKWLLKGYLKAMSSYSINGLLDQESSLQLLHNRLNFFWQPDSVWVFNAELRTRLYWGNFVRDQVDDAWVLNKTEALKLHSTWVHSGSWILHSNLERFSLMWSHKKIRVRAGRQRINWGLISTWNPNDIFNTYSFLDFDYEERPGSDAAKITWNTGVLSSLEAVVALASGGRSITALRYFFNKKGVDYQLLGGYYLGRPTLGIGWSGEINGAGFKGEAQYFFNKEGHPSRLNASIELDYLTSKEWYWVIGALLNSRGLSKPLSNWSLVSFDLSPENMMPGKFSGLVGFRKQWHPLWTSGATLVYSPGIRLFLGVSNLQFNVSDRMDLDLVSQHFFGQQNSRLSSINQSVFLRCKYSF